MGTNEYFILKLYIFKNEKKMLAAMSSSNEHRPIPVRRSVSSNPFPSLPAFSFNEVVIFAQLVQDSLNHALEPPIVSVTGTKAPTPLRSSLYLPLVTPNQPNYRLSVADDNSVFVVCRKSYLVLKDALLRLNIRKYSGMYLR
jgi:hypothetical protein